VLTRVSGLALPLLIAGWHGLRSRRSLRAWLPPALLVLGAVAAITPWTAVVNEPGAPFVPVARNTWLNLYIGNAEPVYGAAPVNHYESLGSNRIEREAAARERVLEIIGGRLPAWPFEKLASELPNFFTPTSFAVRRLKMPDDHPWRPNRAWSYAFAASLPGERSLRWLAAAGVVAAYLGVLALGSFGILLAPASPARTALLLFLLSQIAPTMTTFAISRFRIPAMAVFLVGAAWWWCKGREAQAGSTLRRRFAFAGALTALALAALRWEHLIGVPWA
jgi:hypothetical protein